MNELLDRIRNQINTRPSDNDIDIVKRHYNVRRYLSAQAELANVDPVKKNLVILSVIASGGHFGRTQSDL